MPEPETWGDSKYGELCRVRAVAPSQSQKCLTATQPGSCLTSSAASCNELAEGLVHCCAAGQFDQLYSLLDQTQNIDPTTIPTPQYLLQEAAKNGQAEVVRYLFVTLPECRHRKPWTPRLPEGVTWNSVPRKWRIYEDGVIIDAIEGKHPIKVFEVFFDYGMSANYNLDRAISPLARVIGRKIDFTRFLLQKGANPNGRYIFEKDTFLGAAARLPTPDMLNLLIQFGARLQGSHALRQAAQFRQICNARRLLELGADVNEVFTRPVYDTPYVEQEAIWGCALHFAIKGGELNVPIQDSPAEMVQFLLDNGARTDILDGDGKTPLQIAQVTRQRDVIQVFRKHSIEH
ncbi:ankyrin repeat protein [Hyaloscypha variabilis]